MYIYYFARRAQAKNFWGQIAQIENALILRKIHT
jgi:hypothetical protein